MIAWLIACVDLFMNLYFSKQQIPRSESCCCRQLIPYQYKLQNSYSVRSSCVYSFQVVFSKTWTIGISDGWILMDFDFDGWIHRSFFRSRLETVSQIFLSCFHTSISWNFNFNFISFNFISFRSRTNLTTAKNSVDQATTPGSFRILRVVFVQFGFRSKRDSKRDSKRLIHSFGQRRNGMERVESSRVESSRVESVKRRVPRSWLVHRPEIEWIMNSWKNESRVKRNETKRSWWWNSLPVGYDYELWYGRLVRFTTRNSLTTSLTTTTTTKTL